MGKSSKGRVGLGNVISLAGLSLMGFFTFMGALMLTKGNMGASVGIAIATVVVLSLIIGAAVHCKKVDTDFAKWKKVEIGALIVFVLAAVYPAKYVIHFFGVMSNKESLQKEAMADAEKIRGMFHTYEDAERSAIAVTTTGLQNAFGEESDMNVKEYLTSAAIKSYGDIDTWMLNERRLLLGDSGADGMASYLTYKSNVDSILNNWIAEVKAWDVMSVGRQSRVPSELAPTVAEELSKRSQTGKLPVIEFSEGIYVESKSNQTVTISTPEMSFEKKLTTPGAIGALNMVIYLVILALISLQYVMTPRSEKTEIGEDQNISNIEGVNKL
ncbi:MAG: hypothetical protein PUD39_04150 [Bacteroidales bacterium]|nr:hypothetical protein [Bacteroidales bacterium]